MGNEPEQKTNKSLEPRRVPYIYNTSKKRLFLKYLREKLFIQNSRSNGRITSFDAVITAQVICPNAELLVECGFGLKTLSRIERMEYNGNVNIIS